MEKTERHNLFSTFVGEKGGGMGQLTTDKSAIQRQYLMSYGKEVGALIYDRRLDTAGLTDLGRIMLGLEIHTTPARFSFPIKLCSIATNQRPTCQGYDH
jgi:hypothetical protein